MIGITADDAVFSLAVIDGQLVATGEHRHQGALWSSVDAEHWALVPGFPAEPVGTDAHAQLHSLTPGTGGFVAIGGVYAIDWGTPRIWFSVEGDEWDDVLDPADPFKGVPGGIDDVASWDKGYVAVGGICRDYATCSPQVWLSADGRTWSTVDSTGLAELSLGLGHVAAGNETVVALGYRNGDSTSVASHDGVTWELAPDQPALAGVSLISVAFGNGTFVAGGNRTEVGGSKTPGIWQSTDGLTWTQVMSGDAGLELREIAATGQGFVAIGDDLSSNPNYDPSQASALEYTLELWSSPDGTTWQGPIVGYAGGWNSFDMAFLGNEIFVPGAIAQVNNPDFKWVVFRGVVPQS
jgi:hypothetical protein